MIITQSLKFTGKFAWDALPITSINGITIQLHWTDKPYIWHKNDGDEIFIVLDGQVLMKCRKDGIVSETIVSVGDICYLPEGEEHIASPYTNTARILVIEKSGSV